MGAAAQGGNVGMGGKEGDFESLAQRVANLEKKNDAFNVYIIEWRLPDMNGIEVTRQIRSLGDDTPIIILTAYDWNDIEEEALAAGVTAFCSKPMFMSDLRDSLLAALGQRQPKSDYSLPSAGAAVDFTGKRLLLAEDTELNREIAV